MDANFLSFLSFSLSTTLPPPPKKKVNVPLHQQIKPVDKLWECGLGHYMKSYMKYILSKFAFIIVMTK